MYSSKNKAVRLKHSVFYLGFNDQIVSDKLGHIVFLFSKFSSNVTVYQVLLIYFRRINDVSVSYT